MSVHIIVALDKSGGFGKQGKIPWNIPEDMKHFSDTTKGHICVMGRKTYEDMLTMRLKRLNKGKRGKARTKTINGPILPNRTCYVLTSNVNYPVQGATCVTDINEVYTEHKGKPVFILGGERLFLENISKANSIITTVIPKDYKCDKFFPVHILDKHFKIASGQELHTEKHGTIYTVTYIPK